MPEGTAPTPVRIGRVERLVALRCFPGWADLPSSELASLADLAHPLRVPAGTVLLREGERVTRVYLVVSGSVTLRRAGRELGRYGAHSAVGGLGAFAGDEHGYGCVALEESLVLELRADALEELFEERFELLLRVAQTLARETVLLRQRLPSGGFSATAAAGEQCPARPLDLVERIFFLRRNLAFSAGRLDSVGVLARSAEELRLAEGAGIFRAGDRADFMLAIVCGTIAGRAPDGGRFELGANDFVGGLDMVAGIPRWYDTTVKDGLVALRLDRDALMDTWEDHPDIGMDVVRAFSASLLSLIEQAAV